MKSRHLRYTAPLALAFIATGANAFEVEQPFGPNPTLPEPQRGLLPNMGVLEPAEWGDQVPSVPEGFTIEAIARDLQIPRQTLLLPNGDILVAEGSGGNAPKLKPKDFIAGLIKSQGKTSAASGNRLTLLQNRGDGSYEPMVFADDLNAPYGLALIDDSLYVANQDALVRFDYNEGQTEASGPPEVVAELPAEINHHWTKAMAASADGEHVYVGIGSNSNITERGMAAEVDRAEVWEINVETGAHRPYATGLRNPSALTIQPDSGALWAVVNERDELGPDLVPDYLTSVQEGGFYGWPYSYWGQHVDPRVRPQNPEKVEAAIAPDYSLGSHVAPLGVAFSTPAMGDAYADGVFVGEHGSWNRTDPAGYKVVFIPFSNGQPDGDPIDFASGFISDDGHAMGRPVGVTIDPDGALIIADDLSNTIWRVTSDNPPASPQPASASTTEQADDDGIQQADRDAITNEPTDSDAMDSGTDAMDSGTDDMESGDDGMESENDAVDTDAMSDDSANDNLSSDAQG